MEVNRGSTNINGGRTEVGRFCVSDYELITIVIKPHVHRIIIAANRRSVLIVIVTLLGIYIRIY